MVHKVMVGDKEVILEHIDVEGTLDVDELTTINISNLYGDAMTSSASLNRIGMLRAEAQNAVSIKKLRKKVFESNFKDKKRKEAAENAGKYTITLNGEKVDVKLTEKALETCFYTDPKWVSMEKEIIEAQTTWEKIDSLYWSAQAKDKKIGGLINGITPEDFIDEMLEGRVNGYLIKKQ